MMRYLNMRGPYGLETIDELDPADFPRLSDFRAELRRLIYEYMLSGYSVYWSQRPTNKWKDRQ